MFLKRGPDQIKRRQYGGGASSSNTTQLNGGSKADKNDGVCQATANQGTTQEKKKKVFFLFSIPSIILFLIFYQPIAFVLIAVRIILELVRRFPKRKKVILIGLSTMVCACFVFLLWIGLTYEAPDVPASTNIQGSADGDSINEANAPDDRNNNLLPKDNMVGIAEQAGGISGNDPHAETNASSAKADDAGDKIDMDNLYASDPLYLKAYLDMRNIKVHKFSKMDKLEAEIAKITSKDTGEVHYVEMIDKAFQQPYFGVTIEHSNTYYIGELKDMVPHGVGILFRPIGDIPCVMYMGEFKSGRFEGLGMEFNVPNSYTKEFKSYPADSEKIDDAVLAEAVLRLNYCIYQGEFEEGKRHGKGNVFEYPLIPIDEISAKVWTDKELTVRIAEYKKDKLDGKYKTYFKGILYEEGTTSTTVLGKSSKIKRYFPGTTQLWYEGELKDDKYNGKGTLYTENGEIVYSGEWKNGDIAK